jgi:hypothetical protein
MSNDESRVFWGGLRHALPGRSRRSVTFHDPLLQYSEFDCSVFLPALVNQARQAGDIQLGTRLTFLAISTPVRRTPSGRRIRFQRQYRLTNDELRGVGCIRKTRSCNKKATQVKRGFRSGLFMASGLDALLHMHPHTGLDFPFYLLAELV